jgi:TetR/AcrR family transcriptional repressor of nem operon
MTTGETRQLLIETGLKALLANGYDGTGLGPILAEAGVPKGSFYYFFASKEAFACEVLAAYAQRYRESVAVILADRSLGPRQRLERYFGALEAELRREQPLGGCLYGVMAQTMSARGEKLRDAVQDCFAVWETRLQAVLAEAEAAGELAANVHSAEAAAFLIEAYEGALIRIKADGNCQPLERFRAYALARLFRDGAA